MGIRVRNRDDDIAIRELGDFAEWVAQEVCRDDFEDDSSTFAEICCRKLYALGFVEKVGDNWHIGGNDEKV